jgi:hypothetical protein
MADECTLLDNKAKREIALKNAALVFGLFAILGSPPLWRLVGGLFNKAPVGSLRNNRNEWRILSEVFQRDPGLKTSAINTLGGFKISWPQTLLHALLAGLLTGLITYLSMSPGKDKETCPKEVTITPVR